MIQNMFATLSYIVGCTYFNNIFNQRYEYLEMSVFYIGRDSSSAKLNKADFIHQHNIGTLIAFIL